jgi:hypothetical protein
MLERIQKWAEDGSHFMGTCFDLSLPILDYESNQLDPFVRFVLAQLYISCHQTSKSILILTCHQKEWDASILERTLMEGSIKFAFIAHGNDEEIKSKAEEFWGALQETYDTGRHARAEQLIGVIGDAKAKAAIGILLSEEELSRIQSKFSKSQRKALQQKWAFLEILKYFSNHQNPEFQMFKALSLGYGLGSHLIHKDATGIGMEWERSQREHISKHATTQAHIARLVSSAVSWSWINTMFLFKIINKDLSELWALKEEYKALFNDLDAANKEFEQIEYD